MKKAFAFLAAAALLTAVAGVMIAADAPATILYETKQGNVTFPHQKHVDAAKGDCKACHDTLFKQAKSGDLGYKAAMHKTAETNKTSCGACHHAGGASFESKANCAKCHEKKS